MAERGLTRALASPKMAPHVLAVAKQSLRSLGSDRVLCYTLSDAPWAISAMLKLTSQTPLQFSESFRGYTGLVALNAAVTSEWHAVSSLCKNDVLAFVQAHEKFGEIAAECLLGLAHMDTEYFKLLANRGWHHVLLNSLEAADRDDAMCMRLELLAALMIRTPVHDVARRLLRVVEPLASPCSHAAKALFHAGRVDRCGESLALAACISPPERRAIALSTVSHVISTEGFITNRAASKLVGTIGVTLEDAEFKDGSFHAALHLMVLMHDLYPSHVGLIVLASAQELAFALRRRNACVEICTLLDVLSFNGQPLPHDFRNKFHEAGGTEALAALAFGPTGMRLAALALFACLPASSKARAEIAAAVVDAAAGRDPYAVPHTWVSARFCELASTLSAASVDCLKDMHGEELERGIRVAKALRRNSSRKKEVDKAEARAMPTVLRNKRVAAWERHGLSFAMPPGFFCPITCDVMKDPVQASDGNTYERHAIEAVLAGDENPVSPLTRAPLDPAVLVPNRALAGLRDAHVDGLLSIADAAAKAVQPAKKRRAV